MRVEGLRQSTKYNGLFGHVEQKLEGGRYRVVFEQGCWVLSLKGNNLMPNELEPEDLLLVEQQIRENPLAGEEVKTHFRKKNARFEYCL